PGDEDDQDDESGHQDPGLPGVRRLLAVEVPPRRGGRRRGSAGRLPAERRPAQVAGRVRGGVLVATRRAGDPRHVRPYLRSTLTGSCSAAGISKYASSLKPKDEAMRFEGNTWMRVL